MSGQLQSHQDEHHDTTHCLAYQSYRIHRPASGRNGSIAATASLGGELTLPFRTQHLDLAAINSAKHSPSDCRNTRILSQRVDKGVDLDSGYTRISLRPGDLKSRYSFADHSKLRVNLGELIICCIAVVPLDRCDCI